MDDLDVRAVNKLTSWLMDGKLEKVTSFLSHRPDLLSGNELMYYTRFSGNVDKMVEFLIGFGYDVKEDENILEMFCSDYDRFLSDGLGVKESPEKTRLRKTIMTLIKHGANTKYLSRSFVDENFGG